MTPTADPPGWVTSTWRRPIRRRLLTAGAVITAADVLALAAAVATHHLPLVPAGIVIGLLAALWSHYLTRPTSITHAHRTTPEEPAMTLTTHHQLHPETHSTLLAAALDYAARGWHVFPLRPGTKRPAVPDHPAHRCDRRDPRCTKGHTGWEQRATTDPNRIERAWTRHPYGIAIACGPSGLVVIDLDIPTTPGHPTGLDHLTHLEHHHQPLPATYTVTTPSGGQHRYHLPPPGPALTNTTSRAAPHIDTRATGGYIVAPPTTTPTGTYHVLDDRPPAELPAWLAHLLTRPQPPPEPAQRPAPAIDRDDKLGRYVTAAVEGELRRLATAGPGARNNTLFTVAVALGQLVGAALLDLDDAHHRLHQAAGGHINAGAYSHTQAAQTITSGLHRGQSEPRRLPVNLTRQENHQ